MPTLSFEEVQRRQRQRRRMRHNESPDQEPESTEPAQQDEAPEPSDRAEQTDTTEGGEKPEAESTEPTADEHPGALTAHHKGGGYYEVRDYEGKVVQDKLRKDEAQALVEGSQ